MLQKFKWYAIILVPWTDNVDVDCLARLASRLYDVALIDVLIEILEEPSVKVGMQVRRRA